MIVKRHVTALLSLLLALAVSGCEAPPSAEGPTAPRAGATALNTQTGTYTLIQGRIPSHIGDLSVSKLIGTDGGSLSLAGHSISVPAGAVSQPTVFTLALLTNGLVEVDLTALTVDLSGKQTDVGARGFKGKKVTLKLTYAWASDVSDPSRLLILHRRDDGSVQPVASTVDVTTKTVTAQLEHFSRYCIATN